MLICCIFSGCSEHKVSDITPKITSFKCDFEITESDLSGQLSVNSEGDLSVIFNGPDIINGTAVRVKEESVILEFQGISERYSRDETPDDSPAVLLYDAFSNAQSKIPTLSDGDIIVQTATNDGKCRLTLNGMGFVTKIETPQHIFTFSNHVEINDLS